MRVFLLFIVATALALPRLPGSDFVGVGFDSTTMELRGLPVIAYTWDDSNTYTNPIYPELTYLVPLEFYVSSDTEGLIVDGTLVFRNISDYQRQEVEKKTKRGFLGFGSRSKTTIDYEHQYFEEDSSLSFTHQYHAWFGITLPPLPPPELHPRTNKIVSTLPKKYSVDRKSPEWNTYRRFIEIFGTHYVNQAVMGGMIKMNSWYHKCFLSQYSEHWVTKQSSWSFFGIIHWEKGKNHGTRNTSVLWNEYTTEEISLRGGNGVLFKPTEHKDWIPSIKYDPDPIHYTLAPITDLIPDPTVKANLVKAVEEYFMDAYKEGKEREKKLIPDDPHPRPDWCKV